jgi:hypothetical protein
MDCKKTQKLLNAYLDDVLAWHDAQTVEAHLAHCLHCAQQHRQLQALRHLMRSLRRWEPSEEMILRLKIAASKQNNGWNWARAYAQFSDVLRPVLLPAFSGVVLTFLLFLVPLNSLFPGSRLSASGRDNPIGFITEPRPDPCVQQFMEMDNFRMLQKPIKVQTYVGDDGRVTDYEIIEGPRDRETIRKLDQFFFFQVIFDPATVFGHPTKGTFIWAFDDIDVVG